MAKTPIKTEKGLCATEVHERYESNLKHQITKELFGAIAELTQEISKVHKRIDGIVASISNSKSIKRL